MSINWSEMKKLKNKRAWHLYAEVLISKHIQRETDIAIFNVYYLERFANIIQPVSIWCIDTYRESTRVFLFKQKSLCIFNANATQKKHTHTHKMIREEKNLKYKMNVM